MMNTYTEKAIFRVRAFLHQAREAGWSNLKFAKLSDVPESTWRRVDDNDFNPTATTLKKMELAVPSDFMPEDPLPRNANTG